MPRAGGVTSTARPVLPLILRPSRLPPLLLRAAGRLRFWGPARPIATSVACIRDACLPWRSVRRSAIPRWLTRAGIPYSPFSPLGFHGLRRAFGDPRLVKEQPSSYTLIIVHLDYKNKSSWTT